MGVTSDTGSSTSHAPSGRGNPAETPVFPSRWIPLSAVAITLGYLTDVFVLNQGALAALMSLVGAGISLALLIAAARRGQRGRAAWLLAALLAWLALGPAAFGTNLHLNANARHRADHVVRAIERYHVDHGQWPGSLDALVPDYLAGVPAAKPTVLASDFDYWRGTSDSGPSLSFVRFPPFARSTYWFNERAWSGSD